jgi:diguanylate cyclase (GGDEF)-like protein/PAS domain S-box-containing protein
MAEEIMSSVEPSLQGDSDSDKVNIPALTDTQLIHTIMDNSQDTIYFKDANSKFLLNSKAHAIQFGVSDPLELVGKCDNDFFPESFTGNAQRDEQEIMRTGVPIIGRIEKWVRDNGELVWFSASKYPLYDSKGNIVGTWGTSRDISALKNSEIEIQRVNQELALANAKLKKISVMDELSDLFNLRYFYEIMSKTMMMFSRVQKRGVQSTFSLLLIDIDDFKRINDVYGHLVGDQAIYHVAQLLKRASRTSDDCFRYGGDEFAVILPDTDRDEAFKMAERLRKTVEKNKMQSGDISIGLKICLGVATYTFQSDPMEIVSEADKKLYESKGKGKNQVS